MNNRKNRGLSGLTLLVFVAVLFAALWFTNQIDQREKVITYQEFTQLAGGGGIDTVEVIQNKNVPTGRLEIAMKSDVEGAERKILYVSDVNEIQDYLQENTVFPRPVHLGGLIQRLGQFSHKGLDNYHIPHIK